MSINAKCGELITVTDSGRDVEECDHGCYPGLSRVDYVNLVICLNCGQVQGQFPHPRGTEVIDEEEIRDEVKAFVAAKISGDDRKIGLAYDRISCGDCGRPKVSEAEVDYILEETGRLKAVGISTCQCEEDE